ncbi:fimbrial protein [Kluyvera cryocrescens]|uniref:fimbrial protein n=1 Tax=Kluyvera cryocrescens TaxID=580 RepID=UPI003D7FDC2A
MKNNVKMGTILSLIMISSAQTHAATVSNITMPTGTLNITGKIIDKGCTFDAAAKDLVIQLKPVALTSFTAVGDLGPKSDPVDFKLTGCPLNTTLSLTVQGTAGALPTTFATATGTTNTTGIDFILFGPVSASVPIKPNAAITLTPDASGNYSGALYAQIRSKVATPTAGKIDTTLTYTLAYN